jgi:hypothetical protein
MISFRRVALSILSITSLVSPVAAPQISATRERFS